MDRNPSSSLESKLLNLIPPHLSAKHRGGSSAHQTDGLRLYRAEDSERSAVLGGGASGGIPFLLQGERGNDDSSFEFNG